MNDRPLEMGEAEYLVWLKDTFDGRGLRRGIGGSQIGALMGLNKYQAPADVWDALLAPKPREANRHMDRGIRMEPVICDIYAEETGRRLAIHPPTYMEHEGTPLRAMVDRLVHNGETVGVLEVKCPDSFGYEATKENGIDPSYYAQIQQYMLVEACPWGAFAVFSPAAWELHHFDVTADAAFQDEILRVGGKFWHEHILTRQRPSCSASGFATVAATPFRLGAEAILWSEPAQRALVANLHAAKESLTVAEKYFEMAKTAVQEEMKRTDAEVIACPGAKISWKEVTRRSLDKDALVADGIDVTKYEKVSVSRTFLPKFK